MHRENLKKDHGMLFVFEQPSFLSFWMKNTKIPLSIAYINENCKITEILKMEPHYGKLGMPPNYPSQTRVNYALEMNQGWFEKNQGQYVHITNQPKTQDPYFSLLCLVDNQC